MSLARIALTVPVALALCLTIYFIGTLAVLSIPSLVTGKLFSYSETMPALYGSLVISTIAVLIAFIFSISLAVLVNEFTPKLLGEILSLLIDTLAAFPTVIFGIWGLLVFAPYFRKYVEMPLYLYLGFLPPFSYMPVQLQSALLTGVVLGLMVTPYAAAIIREAYRVLPIELRETVLALGGGKWELVKISLSSIRDAIVGGLTLSFGKAIGETAAVALLIGGRAWFCPLTAPCEAIPSLIVSEIELAMIRPELRSIIAGLALILFIVGAIVLAVAKLLVKRWYV